MDLLSWKNKEQPCYFFPPLLYVLDQGMVSKVCELAKDKFSTLKTLPEFIGEKKMCSNQSSIAAAAYQRLAKL